MQSIITTARLSLNAVTIEDHQFVSELVNSKGWIEFVGDRKVHSKEDAIAYINKIINTPDLSYWVVRVKGTNTPLGIISFNKRDHLKHFDIGFAFLPNFFGNGYAYEAAKEVLSIIRKDPKYNPVLATTMPQNRASIKLLEKLGLYFIEEIELPDKKMLVYSTATI